MSKPDRRHMLMHDRSVVNAIAPSTVRNVWRMIRCFTTSRTICSTQLLMGSTYTGVTKFVIEI